MKAISLFSGMGGDTLGMMDSGVNVIAYNEFDKTAIQSHEANFPNTVLIKSPDGDNDIIKIPDSVFTPYQNVVDLIFAGFPCQGFSHGGKKLPDDPRNTLFREFVRVTDIIRPKFVIGENVDGLLSRKTADGRNYIDVIEEAFGDIGYNLTYKVCHAVRYGVPQLRKRLIIVGVRDDLDNIYTFPDELNDGKTNLPNLKDIIQYDMTGCAKVTKKQFDFDSIPSSCIIKNMRNIATSDETKVHPYLRLKLDTPAGSVTNAGKTFQSVVSFGKRESPYHVEVIDIFKPSKTIICSYDHQPRLLVPIKNKSGTYLRTLLPYELKQIQGFPKDFIVKGNDKQQIKQIGNAVPPPLISAIVSQIRELYDV